MSIDFDVVRAVWNASTKVLFTVVFTCLVGLALYNGFPMAAAFFGIIALGLAAYAYQGAKREWIRLKVTNGKLT